MEFVFALVVYIHVYDCEIMTRWVLFICHFLERVHLACNAMLYHIIEEKTLLKPHLNIFFVLMSSGLSLLDINSNLTFIIVALRDAMSVI